MTRKMLVYELSDDMNHIRMHLELIKLIVGENEDVIFHDYFFNIDISLTI